MAGNRRRLEGIRRRWGGANLKHSVFSVSLREFFLFSSFLADSPALRPFCSDRAQRRRGNGLVPVAVWLPLQQRDDPEGRRGRRGADAEGDDRRDACPGARQPPRGPALLLLLGARPGQPAAGRLGGLLAGHHVVPRGLAGRGASGG